MNLVIDQGNTFNKIGVFDKGQLIHTHSCKLLDKKDIHSLNKEHSIDRAILSSVRSSVEKESLMNYLKNEINDLDLITLSSETLVPFENQYKTPKTLGKDRIAALAGAVNLFPNQPKLIIDAGTAITIDYLNENNIFNGGNISPGIKTRFKSLHQNTGKLPSLDINEKTPFLGQNTNEAIWSGVQNSVVFEIDAYIDRYNSLNNSNKTILTGGDGDFFANNLKNRIFVVPNLVLTGLNTILNYNV